MKYNVVCIKKEFMSNWLTTNLELNVEERTRTAMTEKKRYKDTGNKMTGIPFELKLIKL